MTRDTATNIVEAIADCIQDALQDAENAYWYRLAMDKATWQILHSTPEQYYVAGAGRVIAKRKHVEAADNYTQRKRAVFVAEAVISEMSRREV